MQETYKRKSWEELRGTGLLLFINSILHVFGWAIVCVYDSEGELTESFPARVSFRGFDHKQVAESHKKIAEYLKDNVEELIEETSH